MADLDRVVGAGRWDVIASLFLRTRYAIGL